MLQNLTVGLNKLVKIRFLDGEEMLIRIFDNSPLQTNNELPVNIKAPLGKAVFGHTKGEQIEYQVRNIIHKVTILDIYNS